MEDVKSKVIPIVANDVATEAVKKVDGSRKRIRRAKVLQYEKNPKTGESLHFNESNIEHGLDMFSYRLTRWAWVKHDKDTVTEADIKDSQIEEDYKYNLIDMGRPKGTHWHIVLEFKNPTTISAIAKAFGVPSNFVEAIEGGSKTHDPVLDMIRYLTHEDEKQQSFGKHLYERKEVNVSDPLIWELVDMQVARESLQKGGSRADVRVMIDKISKGMTLSQAYAVDNVMFVENRTVLKAARQEYIKNAPIPAVRTNYYITGEGGAGKSLSAKVFARSLRPDIERDEELFFVVGDGAVPFDGYDGQPIIIWDDWRAEDILQKWDRSTMWKLFAINPERIDVNIKYGSIRLINSVNIVTSVQSYSEFNEGLAGAYKDSNGIEHKAESRKQAYRRFPFFVEVSKESVTLAKVRGLRDDELGMYDRMITFENNMAALAEHQERGRRLEVTKYLEKPLARIEEVTADYQNPYDELPDLGEIVIIHDDTSTL